MTCPFLADLVPLPRGAERLAHLGQQEVRRGKEERDVGVGLERVGQAGERDVGVPLGGDARHHLDDVGVLRHGLLEAVAALDGVRVAEVADQDRRLVLLARRLGDLAGVEHRVASDLLVVGLDGDRVGVRLRRRAVEVDHRDIGLVGRPDGRDHRVGVGLHDDDAVHAPRDGGANLLELLVVVLVRDRLEDLEAAVLHLLPDDLDAGHPELGVEPVEQHGDRLAVLLRADGQRRAVRGGDRREGAEAESAPCECHCPSSHAPSWGPVGLRYLMNGRAPLGEVRLSHMSLSIDGGAPRGEGAWSPSNAASSPRRSWTAS